mgnify:FL=1
MRTTSFLVMNRRKFGLILLAIFFAVIFFRLGVWQLDRARLMQEISKPQTERSTVELRSIADPNKSLNTDALNRIVRFKGQYIANLKAPNQEDATGKVQTWIVGIFQVSNSGKIAVVRGIDGSSSYQSGSDTEVVGRLLPSQINNKFGEVKAGYLSRIDSALLLSDFGSDFYDGYVIAQKEVPDSGIKKVPSPIPEVKVAGFYWQHISYVIIWWLFALLALAAPFIRSNR